MVLLIAALAVSDAALAVAVFLWLLRPEGGARLLAVLTGRGEAWDLDELAPAQEAALIEAARHARPWLVLGLFLYSFLCGVLMTFARL